MTYIFTNVGYEEHFFHISVHYFCPDSSPPAPLSVIFLYAPQLDFPIIPGQAPQACAAPPSPAQSLGSSHGSGCDPGKTALGHPRQPA